MSKAVNVNIRKFISGVFSIPCEQLVSATLPERETTANNCLIVHRACAKYVAPHVMYLTSLRLILREITTQQARPLARPNAADT